MGKFKVWARYTNYCFIEIKANSKEEAEGIGENTDGGDFDSSSLSGLDDGGWEIVKSLTKEIENVIEQCEGCGCDVVFESYEGSPREYDVCGECDRHLCPDCMGGCEGLCKDCRPDNWSKN